MTDVKIVESAAVDALRRRLLRVQREREQAERDYDHTRQSWDAMRPVYDADIADLRRAIEQLGGDPDA